MEAVKEFFISKMLKSLTIANTTLVPKASYPNSLSDFSPIACCNTILKYITNLIFSRLNSVLPQSVAPNRMLL